MDLTTAYILPTEDCMNTDGYLFNGWFDNPYGKGEPITEISANRYDADTIYYAVWTKTNL